MFLKDLFFKNIFIKLTSFGLAVLLWSFVVGQEKAEINLAVPVTIVNIPDGMVISNDFPANINVRLYGPKMMLARLSGPDLTRVIDLKKAESGDIKIEITSGDFTVPGGVSISRIQPSEIDILLEPLVTRKVKVAARIEGKVNSDYTLSGVVIKPSEISLSGPESKLFGLRELFTKPVNVENASATIIQNVKVMIPYDVVRSAETDQVEVKITVTPDIGKQKYAGVKVVLEPALPDGEVSFKPDEVTVIAKGEKPRLHNLKSEDLRAALHLSGMKKGRHRLKPHVTLPFGINVVKVSPRLVTVWLKHAVPAGNSTSENVSQVENRQ